MTLSTLGVAFLFVAGAQAARGEIPAAFDGRCIPAELRASLIENVMGGDVEGGGSFPPAELRARYGLRPGQPVVLYTGTFEPCQGLDLLFDTAAVLGGHASPRTRPRRRRHAGSGRGRAAAGGDDRQPADLRRTASGARSSGRAQ